MPPSSLVSSGPFQHDISGAHWNGVMDTVCRSAFALIEAAVEGPAMGFMASQNSPVVPVVLIDSSERIM